MTESAESPLHPGLLGGNLQVGDVARIVDSGPFGYVTAGPQELIDGINRTLTEWLGRESDTIVGKQTFQDLLAPGDRIYYDTHIRPLLTLQREVHEIAVQLVRADGSRLPVLMNSLLRIDDNGDQRIEAVVIDATERRRYEKELLRERQLAEDSEGRLQLMYDVVSGLAGATSVEKVVEVVTERGERWFAGAACSVWLFDPDLRSVARIKDVGGTDALYSLGGDGPALVRLASGELLVIEDVEESAIEYPVVCDVLRAAGYTSSAVAPLLTDGILHGVINYGFSEPHQFDEAERRAVVSLAGQTEQALQRARSIEAERRGRARLESLFQFSARLSAAVSVDDVLQVIAGDSVDLLGASSVRLAVLVDGGTSVRFVGSAGLTEDETTLDLQSSAIACATIRSGEPCAVDSVEDLRSRFPDSPLLGDEGIGRVVAVPLVRDREVLGAWVLAYADIGPPDPDETTLLHLFAEQASQATGRAFFHQSEAAARTRADLRLAISESLNAAITIDDVAEAITVQGRKAFDATGLAVFLADLSRPDSLVMIASVGVDQGSPLHDVSVSQADFLEAGGTENLAPLFLEGSTLEPLSAGPMVERSWEAVVLLPMSVSGHLVGIVVVGFDDATAVTPGIRVALAGLTAEASGALGRARRYELEHEVALTLQESLLPTDLPTPDGWKISARYEPTSDHLVVGGDLFDIIHTDDGRLFVIVGDVVGHGLYAAAAMGQLRSAARALALVSSSPLEVMQGLEAFARSTPGVKCATVACVSIDPNGDGMYACAGHPYPILVRNGGDTELLEGGRSALLGVSEKPPSVARFHMDEGTCLVLYTDGLIEHDLRHIDEGIEHLRTTLTAASSTGDMLEAGVVVDAILGGSSTRDDIVVVCVTRVSSDGGPQF